MAQFTNMKVVHKPVSHYLLKAFAVSDFGLGPTRSRLPPTYQPILDLVSAPLYLSKKVAQQFSRPYKIKIALSVIKLIRL